MASFVEGDFGWPSLLECQPLGHELHAVSAKRAVFRHVVQHFVRHYYDAGRIRFNRCSASRPDSPESRSTPACPCSGPYFDIICDGTWRYRRYHHHPRNSSGGASRTSCWIQTRFVESACQTCRCHCCEKAHSARNSEPADPRDRRYRSRLPRTRRNGGFRLSRRDP